MASGRRDYLSGISPLKLTISLEQEFWNEKHRQWLDPDEFIEYINYTVPEGYRLIITGGLVTCSNPGLQYFYIQMGDEELDVVWYDTTYQFLYDQTGLYKLVAGESAVMWCRNMDSVASSVHGALYGFLEKI